ncbi:MAG TPA: type II secretion system protein GspL [Steroidobacteraceae bacterium]|jgi:general secretion pathway protein L|nr:type II secretion system protein GspL [Steroidobacteraceae bacterium]
MADWFVLRLPHGHMERVSWMPADVRGQPLGAPQLGSLLQAAGAAGGRRVAAIVPSSDVLITEVELPVKSGIRVQQVVPFALEEQLAADIETLHFAAGTRDETTGRTSVAVVTRALMDQWLGELAGAGLTPEVLCTEAALLPENPGHVVVMLEGDTLCVRRAGQSTQALPALDIAAALQALLGQTLASDDLIFYVSPEDWQRRSAEVEALRMQCASLKVQLLNFGPLPLLSPHLAADGPHLNLLTGDYAPKRAFGAGLRRWRLAASLAAALVAVHLLGLALQLHEQHRAEQTLDSAIGQIAGHVLPAGADSSEIRPRIERALLERSGAAGGLMPALATLAGAVQGADGTSVETLSFQNDALDMRLRASNAEKLEQVDQSLRTNGWKAELTSGSSQGGAYEGHIHASAPGSAGGTR